MLVASCSGRVPRVMVKGAAALAGYRETPLKMTTAPRPNVLFIVVADCGYTDLSCCSQTDYTTSALDRLALEGVRFTQAYANAPPCTNTRVAITTGRDQYRFSL
jgi:arylsulfatase A-like enzyme